MPSSAKLFTFSLDQSPTEIEVLSQNTLYDLVGIGFEACDPRPGETVDDHLWNITTHKGVKFACCGPVSPAEFYGCGFEDPLPDVKTTKLAEIGSSLKTGMKLVLEYDYGTTTKHTFTVTDNKTIKYPCMDDFPRRKTVAPPNFAPFTTEEVDLDEQFSALNHWMVESEVVPEVNFFQPGRKHNYGYLEMETPCIGRMIYLADKPSSLDHLLKCLDVGASVQPSESNSWHSVVVLPSGSTKIEKYNGHLEEGFCDLTIVPNSNGAKGPDLASVFPKVAALAGYRKDAAVKKGWIRYKSKMVIVATGNGGTSTRPRAPKGTAYDGTGYHIPAASDEILLRCHMDVDSLQELFCFVEGFLQSL